MTAANVQLPNVENRFYTIEELTELSKLFQAMLEGQGIAFFVVDPSATNRRILINALSKLGFFSLYEAKNAAEGLELVAHEKSPRVVVIVDDALTGAGAGGMDYFTFMEKCKKVVPQAILMFTGAKFTPAKISDLLRSGAAAVFARPLKIEEFFAKLKQLNIKL